MNVNCPNGASGLVSLKICMVYHERLVQLHPLSALVLVKAQNKEEMIYVWLYHPFTNGK